MKNILVFPCGSEIGLEVYKSLKHNIHFNLIGGNSVDDHGRFVYENYIGNLPFFTDPNFIEEIKTLVQVKQIAAIYPTMDSVITLFKQNEKELGCLVIAPSLSTTKICLSKRQTYLLFKNIMPTPVLYENINEIEEYPIFLKPDIGYGSRGINKVENLAELNFFLKKNHDLLMLEYLPGDEFTIDCFTNNDREILFVGPRQRKRISNGISVNTSTLKEKRVFENMAKTINETMELNGSWFFQVKQRNDGTFVLMEIASRLAGSSSVYRIKGINFALLNIYNAFGVAVSIIENDYEVELDRALDNKYKFKIEYNYVYIDFDDTIIINGIVNTDMVSFLYKCINENKKIHLLTKHLDDINESLKKYRLETVFDEIIQIKSSEKKADYIKYKNAIFIDDSFAERKDVMNKIGINVFSVDQIQALL